MSNQNLARRMRIASPCPVGWENMAGDERVRFCKLCQLNVYNISELSADEVRALVEQTEGRICARLYRRADGSVLTRDCPVGLRAFRRRAARVAGAALTALLGLATVGFGQKKDAGKDAACAPVKLKVKREAAKGEQRRVTGVVVDPVGAVVSGAKVTLTEEETKKQTEVTTSDTGEFSFPSLTAGRYTLEVESAGFKPLKAQGLDIKADESLRINVDVQVDMETATVGVLAIDSNWPPEPGRLTISGDTILKLPIPE